MPQPSAPFRWMGSKRKLARQILPHMPDHVCYVEPFAGSAALLFARPSPAKVEVINDLDGDVVALFRVLKHHLGEFVAQFRWALTSRQMFEWISDTPPETLTDIQRAARFYYLQRLCFGGRSTGRTFGVSTTQPVRINLLRIEEELSEIHLRLAQVIVERLPWEACIARYDRPHTLFFVDPPYFKTAGYAASAPWTEQDYQRLAGVLAGLEGRALLTINDHPRIREIFADFRHLELSVRYTIGGAKNARPARELLYFTWDEERV